MEKNYPANREDWRNFPVEQRDTELLIGHWQVMQAWEQPIMDALAEEATWNHGHVLEVGFGMGLSADRIMAHGCAAYTVIEAHPIIAAQAREWALRQPSPVRVIEAFWQDVVGKLDAEYDGILFDTYPLQPSERGRNHFPFIPEAVSLLKPGGVLTYYSDEKLPLRPEHLELIFRHFSTVKLRKVDGLQPPPDCEYWQENYMILPVCKC